MYVLQGTEIPCTRSVSHTEYLAYENSKGEARGKSRHKSNSKGGVRNMEGRNVGTNEKILKAKADWNQDFKKGQTSAKVSTLIIRPIL